MHAPAPPLLSVTARAAFARCSRGSLKDELTFPDVVRELLAAGFERYRVDLAIGEKVAFSAAGAVERFAGAIPPFQVAADFDAAGVRAALAEIQAGAIGYRAFLERIAAAGAAAYEAFLTGRQVVYWGRGGERHVERFPGAEPRE